MDRKQLIHFTRPGPNLQRLNSDSRTAESMTVLYSVTSRFNRSVREDQDFTFVHEKKIAGGGFGGHVYDTWIQTGDYQCRMAVKKCGGNFGGDASLKVEDIVRMASDLRIKSHPNILIPDVILLSPTSGIYYIIMEKSKKKIVLYNVSVSYM